MEQQESKAMLWTGRIISGVIVLFMAFDAIFKFIAPAPVIEASAKLGFPHETLMALGTVLLVSTILYAIKKTSVFGAILLTGYLGGAVAVNVSHQQPMANSIMAITFGVLTWGGLFFRQQAVRDLIPVAKS